MMPRAQGSVQGSPQMAQYFNNMMMQQNSPTAGLTAPPPMAANRIMNPPQMQPMPQPSGGLMNNQMPAPQPMQGGLMDFNQAATNLSQSQQPYSKDVMSIFSRPLPAQRAMYPNKQGGSMSDKDKKKLILSGGAILPKEYRLLF